MTHASAQQNELSGLIGRTFISDQGIKGGIFFDNNVHFGKGLTFEVNYARRVLGSGFASLSLEVPLVVNWDEDLNSDAPQTYAFPISPLSTTFSSRDRTYKAYQRLMPA